MTEMVRTQVAPYKSVWRTIRLIASEMLKERSIPTTVVDYPTLELEATRFAVHAYRLKPSEEDGKTHYHMPDGSVIEGVKKVREAARAPDGPKIPGCSNVQVETNGDYVLVSFVADDQKAYMCRTDLVREMLGKHTDKPWYAPICDLCDKLEASHQ